MISHVAARYLYRSQSREFLSASSGRIAGSFVFFTHLKSSRDFFFAFSVAICGKYGFMASLQFYDHSLS